MVRTAATRATHCCREGALPSTDELPCRNPPTQAPQPASYPPCMTPWKDALTEGLLSGTLAAVLSGVVVSVAGRRQGGSAVAPINAVSHWLWGDAAARDESINARHTGVGAATQMLAGIFWGTLHAKLRPRVRKAD